MAADDSASLGLKNPPNQHQRWSPHSEMRSYDLAEKEDDLGKEEDDLEEGLRKDDRLRKPL